MPGILPMKVIQVGNGSQTRIAQACDRCRSKKIRCDGLRPACSQCLSANFTCSTSDKLSRRAFPRGYTESLEQRVRVLESENSSLKDILDDKDMRLEFLSKSKTPAHRPSHASTESPQDTQSTPATGPPNKPEQAAAAPSSAPEETFRTQPASLQLGMENSDSFYMGPSSGKYFLNIFKGVLREKARQCPSFDTEVFLHVQGCAPLLSENAASPTSSTNAVPPRIFTDKCVNVFFQEWAPLFPVLHKPDFLRTYEDYTLDHDKVKTPYKVAQLHLVFAIASLSSDQLDIEQTAACEAHWQAAISPILMDFTINTLRCVLLAMIYCMVRGDHRRLQFYRSIAVSIAMHLGLHHKQRHFSFSALTAESRKKVFWSLYTLDSFSAAILGLPRLISESQVKTELPIDADDEYITEAGIQPTLPGEATRISAALALFRLARILAKVLDTAYESAGCDISVSGMSKLDTELSNWEQGLPAHLKLNFAHDKPSTSMTGSRAPLLALVCNYIRVLIHRPAIESRPNAQNAAGLLAIGKCSKRIIQIIQLLEERRLSFAVCMNKADTLTLAGLTVIYEGIRLGSRTNTSLQTNIPLINYVVSSLFRLKAPGCLDFKQAVAAFVRLEDGSVLRFHENYDPAHRPRSENGSMATGRKVSLDESSASPCATTPRERGSKVTTSEPDLAISNAEKLRRMTMPTLAPRPSLLSRPRPDSFARRPTSIIPKAPGDVGFDLYYPNAAQESSKRLPQTQAVVPQMVVPVNQVQHGMPSDPEVSSDTLQAMMTPSMGGGTVDHGMNHLFDMIYGNTVPLVEEAVEGLAASEPERMSSPLMASGVDAWSFAAAVPLQGGGPPSLAISDSSHSSEEMFRSGELGGLREVSGSPPQQQQQQQQTKNDFAGTEMVDTMANGGDGLGMHFMQSEFQTYM
ncbi:hypothetical protein TD95_001312 [Thielaviopsis punctulata]|uniref:Zn(2)-C6 fungal-type domain-containing protein n=1 Tax=Thielaviopsis punctulata TaxID=72032 RepID=A0A0F4ZK24_9PEZI|nr:hypothetical protein TD95_001312 [Thielaviopsis punctulata]